MLLEAGADASVRCLRGHTPKEIAEKNKDAAFVQLCERCERAAHTSRAPPRAEPARSCVRLIACATRLQPQVRETRVAVKIQEWGRESEAGRRRVPEHQEGRRGVRSAVCAAATSCAAASRCATAGAVAGTGSGSPAIGRGEVQSVSSI